MGIECFVMSEKHRLLSAVFKVFSPVAEGGNATGGALCGDARAKSMLRAESAADKNGATLVFRNSWREWLEFRSLPNGGANILWIVDLDFPQSCEWR